MEQTHDAVIIIDKEGQIFFLNNSAKRLLGFKKKEIVGEKTQIFQDSTQESELMAKAEKGKQIVAYETKLHHDSGDPIDVTLTMTGIKDEKGELIGFSLLSRDITKRKRAERKVQKLKDKFEDLYNNAPIMYVSVDVDGTIIECNKTILTKLGFTRKELIGKKMTKFITKESAEEFKSDFPKLLKDGKIIDAERQLVSKGGKVIDVILDVTLDYDKDGNPKNTRATFEDITIRKMAEEALKGSEEKHRNLVQSINDLILVLDEDDFFKEFYPSNEIPLYLKPDDFKNKNVKGLLPPQITKPYLELSKKVRKTGKTETFEYPLEMENQEVLYSASLNLHEDGKSIVVVIRDITEHKHTQDALWESVELYHNIFNSSPYLLYRISPDGKIVDCNEAVINTLGYSKAELTKMALINIYSNESKPAAKKYFNEWLKTGKLRNKELSIVTKDGEKLEVELNVNTIYDPNGNMISSISSQKVITKR
jgi:PAS domain S-box-containing protein